ncbi:MAG: carbon storage regulator [Planctomycetaceae bacterium]|jgi:carbon storage regulator|nr:carbon storage regulator [Planctomycetaceae bacterium]
MLVLSRREGEIIRIGNDIFVTIVHAAKDRVRIGIEAPHDAVILREELRPKLHIEQDTVDQNTIEEDDTADKNTAKNRTRTKKNKAA